MGIFTRKPKKQLSKIIEEKKNELQQKWSDCISIVKDLRDKAGVDIMLNIIGDEMISRMKNMDKTVSKLSQALDMSIRSSKMIESLAEMNKQLGMKDSRLDELDAMTHHIIAQANANIEMISFLHRELSETARSTELN